MPVLAQLPNNIDLGIQSPTAWKYIHDFRYEFKAFFSKVYILNPMIAFGLWLNDKAFRLKRLKDRLYFSKWYLQGSLKPLYVRQTFIIVPSNSYLRKNNKLRHSYWFLYKNQVQCFSSSIFWYEAIIYFHNALQIFCAEIKTHI